MKKILTVVGTRPNFIKITQFEKEFSRFPGQFEYRLLHTGQHYDDNMSNIFFQQLDIRKPDYHLNVESGSPTKQIGEIMIGIDKVLHEWQPDVVIVVGDVSSTMAAAIAANKNNILLAHVESGLRSRDRSMPEEINRLLTDEITDVFFITEQSGWENLLNEGKDGSQLVFVGNTMIDTLVAFREQIAQSDVLEKLGLQENTYALMTMHRPATVDNQEGLEKMIAIINRITQTSHLVFPIHPRTTNKLQSYGLYEQLTGNPRVVLTSPLDYYSFQKLILRSKFVITDSGGIQEETTFSGVPCLTLRPNTERPSTITLGTNTLLPLDVETVAQSIAEIENGTYKSGEIPPMWDGHATERIVNYFRKNL